jgi:branched-chain amino acid transport system substrate-binding protein
VPVQRILEMNAAAVYCYYAGPAAVEFIKQLRQAGSRAQIYGPGLLTEGTVLNELGGEAEGIVTALNYAPDLSSAVNRRFTATYRRTHGFAPSQAAVGAYDAAQVLAKSLQATSGPPTAQTVYFGLDRVGQIESPRGTWQFNIVRTPLQRWYLRTVRRDGPVLANVTVSELTTLG